MSREYLRLESALSRLAQSCWRWSTDDLGPVYETRFDFEDILSPSQAAALSRLIMERIDEWSGSDERGRAA